MIRFESGKKGGKKIDYLIFSFIFNLACLFGDWVALGHFSIQREVSIFSPKNIEFYLFIHFFFVQNPTSVDDDDDRET